MADASASPPNRWAAISSLVCSIYFLGVSAASFWTFSYLTDQEEVTTAEGNEEGIWANPRWTSLGVAISFLFIAIAAGFQSYTIHYKATESPHTTTTTWGGLIVVGIISLIGVGVAEWASFRTSTRSKIEEACKTIDEECFANYEKLEWGSIIVSILGTMSASWPQELIICSM
ncbi:uncharacterized protein JCM6883_002361 [Sporobolomyces salmoneus]|uniref:uncharacterized protein n=1 Tax=Sporobolomyces salmoneus TaxID=183962 RepID=UPI00316BE1C1